MVKIAHISDIHFGATDERALIALRTCIKQIAPKAVLVTGDLTQSGRKREFVAASAYFSTIERPVFCIPGNHDTPVFNPVLRFATPWSRFERHFGDVADQILDLGDICLIGVNSARRAAPRLNWSYGRLSTTRIRRAIALASEVRKSGKTPLIATHHPLELGPNKAGAEIVGRAAEAIEEFIKAGIRIIFTGHVHVSNTRPLARSDNRILSIEAGTAASIRQRDERPSFNLVETDGQTYSYIDVFSLADDGFHRLQRREYANDGDGWVRQ